MLLICLLLAGCATLDFPSFSQQPHIQKLQSDHTSDLLLIVQYLYFGSDYFLYRLDVVTHTVDTIHCKDGELFFRPVVDDNYIYSQLSVSRVVALDARTGNVVWEFEGPAGYEGYFYRDGLKDQAGVGKRRPIGRFPQRTATQPGHRLGPIEDRHATGRHLLPLLPVCG